MDDRDDDDEISKRAVEDRRGQSGSVRTRARHAEDRWIEYLHGCW